MVRELQNVKWIEYIVVDSAEESVFDVMKFCIISMLW